jgi:hypothetical protein
MGPILQRRTFLPLTETTRTPRRRSWGRQLAKWEIDEDAVRVQPRGERKSRYRERLICRWRSDLEFRVGDCVRNGFDVRWGPASSHCCFPNLGHTADQGVLRSVNLANDKRFHCLQCGYCFAEERTCIKWYFPQLFRECFTTTKHLSC